MSVSLRNLFDQYAEISARLRACHYGHEGAGEREPLWAARNAIPAPAWGAITADEQQKIGKVFSIIERNRGGFGTNIPMLLDQSKLTREEIECSLVFLVLNGLVGEYMSDRGIVDANGFHPTSVIHFDGSLNSTDTERRQYPLNEERLALYRKMYAVAFPRRRYFYV